MKNFADIICQVIRTTEYDDDQVKYRIKQFDQFIESDSDKMHYNQIIELNQNGDVTNYIGCISAYDEDKDEYKFVFDSGLSMQYDDDAKFYKLADGLKCEHSLSIFLMYKFESDIFVVHIPSISIYEKLADKTVVSLMVYNVSCIEHVNYRAILCDQDDYTYDLQMMFVFLCGRKMYSTYISELNNILKKTLNSDWLKVMRAYYKNYITWLWEKAS